MFLHVETAFSFRASTLMPQTIAQKARERGDSAAAIADVNLHAAVPFYEACREAGVKPVFGLRVRVAQDRAASELIVYAQTDAGFHQLMKLSSAMETKAATGLPRRWLQAYSDGLIAVLPGKNGDHSAEALAFYKQTFSDLYIGLLGTGDEEALIRQARLHDVPLIAMPFIHYETKQSAFASLCLQAIRDNRLIEAEEEWQQRFGHFPDEQELKERYGGVEEALENAEAVARMCEAVPPLGEVLLPSFPLPDGVTAEEELRRLCEERLAGCSKAYQERLDYELSVIDRMKFNDYFLIVHDVVRFAKRSGMLVGPGRGSAAGSLVAYALGITEVDPLQYDLLFERFLNPERASMPDIDIDFPDYRRDEVIQYMVQKYGPLHAAQIVTFGTLSAKAALRDTGRVFGLDSGELSRLSALVPSGAGKSIADADLTNWRAESAVHERIYGVALQLEGLPRHTSTHAAGMVLSQAPLTDHVPIMSGGEGVYMTQYAMGPLQKTGLLKMDLLGLRNLTTIERILSTIKHLYKQNINLHDIDLHDPTVMTMFSEGKTAGLFQFESDGMKNVLTKLMPERFEDLVAVNALYRPGPMEQIPVYIERRHNRQPVPSIHPVLDPILAPTYGLIVYQEQIIRIAVEFAGYTPGEADLLRRAVSKKQKDVLERERMLFLQKSVQKNVPDRVAQDVYNVIVRFADYGFNRSHAVAYSMIGYWLAWLKTHYPACFFAALMQTQAGNETKMQQLKTEARSMNLVFLGPDVNKSESGFTAEKNGIRFGLTAIKGVNRAAAKDIVDGRRNQGAYNSLFDFCARLQNSQVTRPVMEALIWSGALDEFGQSRESLQATLDSALDYAELLQPGDDDLMESFGVSLRPAYASGEAVTAVEKLEREKALLGLYVSAHPVESFRARLARVQCRTADAIQSARLVHMGGMLGDVREIRTKKGDKMAFSMLSDETGEIEVVLFPDVYRSVVSRITKGTLLFLTGAAEERKGRLQLVVKHAVELETGLAEKEDAMRTLFVRIASGPDESRLVEHLYDQLLSAPGFTPVVFHYERTGETVRLSRKYHVAPRKALLEEIAAVCGHENVVLKEPAVLYNPSGIV